LKVKTDMGESTPPLTNLIVDKEIFIIQTMLGVGPAKYAVGYM